MAGASSIRGRMGWAGALLVLTFLLAGCAHRVAAPPVFAAEFPPIQPDHERALVKPSALSGRCHAKVDRAVRREGGRLAASLLTASRRWGEVWRADVRYDDQGALRTSRVLCWQGAEPKKIAMIIAPLGDHAPPILRPRVD